MFHHNVCKQEFLSLKQRKSMEIRSSTYYPYQDISRKDNIMNNYVSVQSKEEKNS